MGKLKCKEEIPYRNGFFLSVLLYFIPGMWKILLQRLSNTNVCKQSSKIGYQGLLKLFTTQTISAHLKTEE